MLASLSPESRMRHFLLGLALSLAATASAQNAAEDTKKADGLRDEGVALFKQKKFAEAAEKYLTAIAAYEEALGAGTEKSAGQAVVLRRAVLWCRQNAGDYSRVAGDLEAFLKADAAVSGNGDEEDSVIACLAAGLEALAAKKDLGGLGSLDGAAMAALDKWIDAAKKQERLDGMFRNLDSKRGGLIAAHAQALFLAGDRAAGEKRYREAIAYFEKRSDADEPAWTAQNAFYDMSRTGTPVDAAFFFDETLAMLAKKEFAQVESYLTSNLRNYLKSLGEAKRWKDGTAFLEAAIAGAPRPGIRGGALDEAALRRNLGVFLVAGGDWAKAVANADELGKFADAANDPAGSGEAEAMAAEALFRSGKADAALARADAAVKKLKLAGEAIREGRARVLRTDILCGLKKFDDGEVEAVAAAALFSEIGYGPGLTEARQARLRNAKAKGDAVLEKKAAADLSGVSAAGGQGGESLSTMAPRDLAGKAAASETPLALLEIRRAGDELKVRNLLSKSAVSVKIEYALRHVNIDGVLLQIRGPEVVFLSVRKDGQAPGTEGESSMSVGGQVTHTAPEFLEFAQRAVATEGSVLEFDSALQIRRKPGK